MPPQAYALVTLFALCSVGLGWLAVRLVGRAGGPAMRAAYILPIAAGFLAFYLIGHKLGISVGPEIPLFGFQVALFGDVAIGLAAALVAALAQAAWLRVRASMRHGSCELTELERPQRRSDDGTSPGSSPVATGRPDRDQSLYDPG